MDSETVPGIQDQFAFSRFAPALARIPVAVLLSPTVTFGHLNRVFPSFEPALSLVGLAGCMTHYPGLRSAENGRLPTNSFTMMRFLIAILFLQTSALHSASVVSGRVLNSDRAPVSNVGVRLVPASKTDAATLPDSSILTARRIEVTAADGAFQFTNVAPGAYTVQLEGLDTPKQALPVTVSDAGSSPLEVVLPAKTEIRGRLILQGAAPLPHISMYWSSSPVFRMQPIPVDVKPDGTFSILVYEGSYGEAHVILPPAYSLQSITYGPLDLSTPAFVRISDNQSFLLKLQVRARESKPVSVSGRVTGLDPVLLASDNITASMQSSSYAVPLSVRVNTDGHYDFPEVFAGTYALTLSGPDVPPRTCMPVVVENTDSNNVDFIYPQSRKDSDDLQIISAIFGAAAGAADVTPRVKKSIRPGLNEVYAAPRWFEVDPAIGNTKQLIVSYLYECVEHTYSTIEPTPISYAILAEHANPSLRTFVPEKDEIRIDAAYWGLGNRFQDVTARVSRLFDAGDFEVSDETLHLPSSNGNKVLIVTYSWRGLRSTSVIFKGTPVRRAGLIADADSPAWRNDGIPEWLTDVQPIPPREPGDPGPGFGPQAKRELAIANLMVVLAELRAIAREDRPSGIATITSITEEALADAKLNIAYTYPRPSSAPLVGPVRPALATSVRLANATRAMKAALQQLTNAGGGPNEIFLHRAVDEAQQAFRALQEIAPKN